MAASDPGRVAHRRHGVLGAIALFKLFKAALFLAVGVGALRLLDPEVAAHVRHWIAALAWSYSRGVVEVVLSALSGASASRLEALGFAALLYAALFVVEGVGLWLERRWAEYLTIVATGMFLPFEVYEVARRATASRGLALALNLGIVVYLVALVRRRDRRDGP